MKKPGVMAASVLPTVLVAAALMLSGVLALWSLSDIEALLSFGNHARRQKQAWLDAALLLAERDSTLFGRLDQAGAFTLFEDEPASAVTLSRELWGLYEGLRAATEGGKFHAARLVGRAHESPRRAALYVCDDGRALTLAGKSELRGTAYLSPSGLLYGQVHSDFYVGDEVPAENIRPSDAHFPALDGDIAEALVALRGDSGPAGEWTSPKAMHNSFHDPPVYLPAENLSGIALRGNIIVQARGPVILDRTSQIEDILLVAPSVRVAEGFSGSLQIVAADSVVVERGARLRYPSGIVIPDAAAASHIRVEGGGEVNGYVILRSAAAVPPEQQTPQYRQADSARVRGLLWIDGLAQVQGTVTGSLYLCQANYYAAEGYYAGLLYHTRVNGATAMAFPGWMAGDYRRKTVKWLD